MTDYSDSFTGTNGNAWASPWVSARRTGSGTSTIDTNRGKQIASTSGNYTDYETQRFGSVITGDGITSGTVRFPTDNEVFAQVWMRGDSTLGNPSSGNGYFWSIEPQYNSVRLYKRVGGTQTALGSGAVAFTLAANTDYSWKMECTGTTIRAKIWTGSEPGSWTQSVTDSSHSSGYVGLSIDGGLASGTAWRADWDAWFFSTPTPSMTLTGSLTPAGALLKRVNKLFTASATVTGLLTRIKVVARTFTATISVTGPFTKRVIKSFSGAVPISGAKVAVITKIFTGTSTGTGLFRKAAVRVLTGSITTVGSIATTALGRVFGRPGRIAATTKRVGQVVIRIRRS